MRQVLWTIPIFGGIKVFGYGMMLFLAFLGSMNLAAWRARREKLDPEVVYDLALWVFLGGLIGARLFYVIQYWGDRVRTVADIFKVSRTLVRQALMQLSRDKLVTLSPSRGAFIATPSIEEAREVFEVRHLVESALIQRLARTITPAQVVELRAHLRDERAAVQRTDVPGRTRLLADFHVVLARMLDNATLAELIEDLLSRSSLISLMYQSAHSAEASYAEHVAIVDALEKRDAKAALRLLEAHLHNVEDNLRLHPRVPDLESALKPLAEAR